MKNHLFLVLFFFIVRLSLAQTTLNAYAKVSAINSGATTLTVTNVNETSHTFTVGGDVIVMQMQDNCIGTNTTNTSTFGDLSTIANAGRYEIRKIASRLPSTGTPTSITLDFALTYTFNTDANSSVQLITFRDLGANYTTTANIGALVWDGNVGGVVAFQVTNTLTLNHTISADGIGFRGGARSSNYGGPVCSNGNQNLYISNSVNYGAKGEGIYKNTKANFNSARGKILSGGGGGGDHNAGGGGGGNFSVGGQGGNGYNNCTTFPGGGLGGISLVTHISSSRIFMGGGGGGGQQNNGVGTNGGNGGGIIFIKAQSIISPTTCASGLRITANGLSAGNTTGGANDGAGGGGAAGSIIINASNFQISSPCSMTISTNGGNGGNSNNGEAHAGGAGGGQGVIIYSSAQPTLNITATTRNGNPGVDNSGGSVSATGGGGPNNSGIISNVVTPLPIELVSFSGECDNYRSYDLKWVTASEINNDYFVIEKSTDAINWELLAQINGTGNSSTIKQYMYSDNDIESDITYYRLKQVDFDGTQTIYPSIIYNEHCNSKIDDVEFYPNPATESIIIKNVRKYTHYSIVNLLGQTVQQASINSELIQISDLVTGIYYLQLVDISDKIHTKKMLVESIK